jgi:pimeloyl-ACP methyl ester carboxylesterase
MDTTSTSPGDGTFTVHGAQIHYRIAGHGPLLVLNPPGWGIGADPYVATLRRLEDTFTIVYLWPRGSARSASQDSHHLNVDRFVADLEALRSHLGVDRFGVAGHSHGGLVALHYAVRYPDAVNQLLLLDSQLTGVPSEPPDASPPRLRGDSPEVAAAMNYLAEHDGFDHVFRLRSDAQAKAFLSRILPLYFADQSAATSLAEGLISTTLPHRTLQAVTATDGDHPLEVAALTRLTVPTVIVAGRQDRICPIEESRSLARIIKGSALVVFDASGHFPWLEEPDSFFERVPAAMLRVGNRTRFSA